MNEFSIETYILLMEMNELISRFSNISHHARRLLWISNSTKLWNKTDEECDITKNGLTNSFVEKHDHRNERKTIDIISN